MEIKNIKLAAGLILALVSPNSISADIKYLQVPKEDANTAFAMSEIYVDGEIDKNTLQQIKSIVDKNNLSQAKIIFNSSGGSIFDALEIGEYLREKEFVTDVGTYDGIWNKSRTGECYSACVYAYLGGKYRFYDQNSKFGVHQFYSRNQKDLTIKDVEQGSQFIASYLVNYIREMGVDVKLFTKISEQASDDIELLDYDEMKKMGIFNDGYLEPEWEFYVNKEGAFYVGTQEQLDQNGVAVFGCANGGIEISFLTNFGSKNSKSRYQSFILIDDKKINIDSKLENPEIDEDGMLKISYSPDNMEILRIMKAEYIGFRHSIENTNYEFTVDISTETKEKVLGFMDFCKEQK